MSSHTKVGAMKDLGVKMDHEFHQSTLKEYVKETSCTTQLDGGTEEMNL